jgi:hypothetical protein
MKHVYFLTSMPRAGNTLLGSILNQNKKINVTSNSIISEMIFKLHELKECEIFRNFPDDKSLNNVIKNVFNEYYKDWKVDYILDRSTWGTPFNLSYLKSIIKKPKFVILYRPVLECLASFIKIEKPTNVEIRCEKLMDHNGVIGKSLWSINNLIKEKEDYIIIHYKNFIKNPNKEIKKIFDFLKIPFKNFNLNNLKQFSSNNISYDDSIFNIPLHTIRTNKIQLNKYNIEDYLPSNIIKKYSNLDI